MFLLKKAVPFNLHQKGPGMVGAVKPGSLAARRETMRERNSFLMHIFINYIYKFYPHVVDTLYIVRLFYANHYTECFCMYLKT